MSIVVIRRRFVLAAAMGLVLRANSAFGLVLEWSYNGPIDGLACVQVNEPSHELRDWDDNYLCSTLDVGLRWSHSGPIEGMECTRIFEPSEPLRTGWLDNYLCVPDSRLELVWSFAGIPSDLVDYSCVQIVEPSEPDLHDWHDNYLCYRADSDGDGLPDVWETQGVDFDGDGVIDVDLPNIAGPGVGTDPNHKDLFVEMDWLSTAVPKQVVIEAVRTAFAYAPVDAGGIANPDGLPGIRLWVDTGTLTDPSGIEGGVGGPGTCSDGLDNDGNNLFDADDPSCLVGDDLSREDPSQPAGSCRDGEDNDGDGFVDAADPECVKAGHVLFDPTASESGGPPDMTCSDGIDNDGDGFQDGADVQCELAMEPGWGYLLTVIQFGVEGLPREDGADDLSCFDGKDNGSEDGAGPGTCSDKIDNGDNDGIDEADSDCDGADGNDTDCGSCTDTNDNDGDGLADAQDVNCRTGGNFDPARARIFRYALTYSGAGNTPIPAQVMFIGNGPSPGTFMHELGHSLGLGHGGIRDDKTPVGDNRKPNYISIMNYDYQECLLDATKAACFRPNNRPLLDYSPARWGGTEFLPPPPTPAENFVPPPGACYDGLDNDGDGLIDAEDPVCQFTIRRADAPLSSFVETALSETQVRDVTNKGHGIVFIDQKGERRFWRANYDMLPVQFRDGEPDGLDLVGDGPPFDDVGLNARVDVNGDSICVCSGPDNKLDTTVVGGDDVVWPAGLWIADERGLFGVKCGKGLSIGFGPSIRNGPNGICETVADADDIQSSIEKGSASADEGPVGSCTDGIDQDDDGKMDGASQWCFEPVLTGSDDWSNIQLKVAGLGPAANALEVDDTTMTLEAFEEALRLLNKADLEIGMSTAGEPVEVGEEFSYQVNVGTNGPNGTAGARIVTEVPNDANVTDFDEACGEEAGALVCDLDLVPLYGAAGVSIDVKTHACDGGVPVPIELVAEVTNVAGPDPDGSNNEASLTVVPVDTTAPVISFNAPLVIDPSDAPVTYTATASDFCDDAVVPVITSVDCFSFTRKNRRIDKTESCIVGLSGDTITIFDAGGVGTHIAWEAEATDASGNTGAARFELQVVLP